MLFALWPQQGLLYFLSHSCLPGVLCPGSFWTSLGLCWCSFSSAWKPHHPGPLCFHIHVTCHLPSEAIQNPHQNQPSFSQASAFVFVPLLLFLSHFITHRGDFICVFSYKSLEKQEPNLLIVSFLPSLFTMCTQQAPRLAGNMAQ
jgi:hypothetical protein